MPTKEIAFKGYLLQIEWSATDQCYIADAPELKGCTTHGSTVEEATENGKIAVTMWLECAKEHGDKIPKPLLR